MTMPTGGTTSMRSLKIPVLTAAVALLGGLLAPVPTAVADDLATDAAVHVVGTLVVIQPEESPTPVTPPQAATDAAATPEAHVLLPDGASVPIDGDLIPADAVSGAPVDVVAAPSTEVLADAGLAASGTVAADSAEGQRILEAAVVADDPLTVVAGEIGAVEVQAAAASHTIDVAVVSNGSTATAANTDDYVKKVVAKVGAFWSEQSAGMVPAITLTTIKRYTSTKGCGTEESTIALWDEAAKKFDHAGGANDYVGGGTKHLFVISPPSCAVTFNGLGSIGSGVGNGGVVWAAFDGGDGSGDELTLAHEIGHNFSLNHANAQECAYPASDPQVKSGTYAPPCTVQPYADVYDVMGQSFVVCASSAASSCHGNDNTPALNAISKVRLGVLSATDAPVIQLTQSTTLTLGAASATAGRRALVLIDPMSRERYVVEYRNGLGRDAGSVYMDWAEPYAHWAMPKMGAGIRILKTGPDGRSSVVLPDATATSSRLAWVPGRTFTSRTRGLKIAVLSAAGATASVQVTIAPQFTGTELPKVSGEPFVSRTLTAEPRTSWAPTPTSYAYHWFRSGIAISGASGKSYTVVAADLGKRLTVRVTASKTGVASRAWVSPATPAIGALKGFTGTSQPTITGARKVGVVLAAAPGANWAPLTAGTTYTYRWYRGTTVIPGAVGRSYRQVAGDVGAVIRVNVTAHRYGYVSKSAPSTATAAKTVK
ncbi:hypothetical protein WJX64_01230 [Leifsonia sp. YIM 134122]|uniref:Peptidase M11 gametolysin domain-containing protein n=1 Tax=Leifsonia stereocauli TaxID=3134136 RepID=A0ABU9VZK2_9MICO